MKWEWRFVAETTESMEKEAMIRLDQAVSRMMEEMEELQERVRRAETKARDAQALLQRFSDGDDDPARQHDRMMALEEENRELRDRLRQGRDGVERILGRIRFLEEEG